ncbi:MAG: acyl--CoA ligase [Acidimicrobiales bacterium]|nr:acyl--CoA ligase [Acidimicrobiales bacterium]
MDLAQIRESVRDELTGSGGPYELTVEPVRGVDLPVFRDRFRSVDELFHDSVARFPEREFLVLEDERLSYAQFAADVAEMAGALRDRYGIEPGDRVAIFAANIPAWVTAFFAITRLGAMAAACNGWWTPDEVRYAIELTEPKLLLGDAKRLARLEGVDVPTVDLEAERDQLRGADPVEDAAAAGVTIGEDDPAVLMFTSGTTGRPKGAVISHRGLVGFVQCQQANVVEKTKQAERLLGIDIPPSTNQKIVLGTSPLFHMSGLHATILLNMVEGAKIVYRRGRFDPADVLRLIETERVTNWSAMGAMGPRVLDELEAGDYDVSSVTGCGFGGAPTSEELAERIRRGFPNAAAAVGAGYGSTESVAVLVGIGGQEWKDNPAAAGRPVMSMELQIRDESGQPVPDGTEGEVYVRSAYNMLEYWRNPEATAETLHPDRWLAMGDIGRIEDDVLYLNSRARDMILRSAENVYPVEIEHRLEAHPDVSEAAVYGVDHAELGQEVKAVVVPSPGHAGDADALIADLETWCAETLARYKVPSLWEVRTEPMPRNATGKVLKGVLAGERTLDQVEE